jgi:cytochrome c5
MNRFIRTNGNRMLGTLALTFILAACTETDPVLEQGKLVWEGTCKVCHLNGLAGAPKMGDPFAWKDRIPKGMDTLVAHALNGFEGMQGQMPARGGNASLSDADIEAAVKYMVSQSQP